MSVYQNNVFTLLTNITVPSQGSEIANFLVKQEGESHFCASVLYSCVHFNTLTPMSTFSAKHEDWKVSKLKVSKDTTDCGVVFKFRAGD